MNLIKSKNTSYHRSCGLRGVNHKNHSNNKTIFVRVIYKTQEDMLGLGSSF